MTVLVLLLHAGVLVAGFAGLWLMLRPVVGRNRTVRVLRRQAYAGTLIAHAFREAVVSGRGPVPRPGRSVHALHAYAFAAISTALAVLTTRLAGLHLPALATALLAGAALAIGLVTFARPRSAQAVIGVGLATQALAHTSAVLATRLFGAHAATGFANTVTLILFCHPVGVTPPAGDVVVAAHRVGAPWLSGALGSSTIAASCLVTAAVAFLANRNAQQAAVRWAQGVAALPSVLTRA